MAAGPAVSAGRLRWAALVAWLLLAVAVLALLGRHALLADDRPAMLVQMLAVLLMLWARLVFGRRSFHAGAMPTAGGLVTAGPYRFLRHPIYAALLYFLWAGAFSHAAPANFALAAVATLAIAVRVAAEERLLAARYPEYAAYAARTKRVVPYLL